MSEVQCVACNTLAHGESLAENAMWVVRSRATPTPVPGWTVVYARHHVRGPADMSDAEAASFGTVLRTVQRAMLEVTGADRIYAVSINDPVEHLHVHMFPRYAGMPVSWASFDLVRQLAAGEIVSDDGEHARLADLLGAQLRADPLPN